MAKPGSSHAFELRILGFFRHFGLGIGHFAERHIMKQHLPLQGCLP
jgi:hypothetical protein